MGFDFRFRSIDSLTDVRKVADFLVVQDLSYPGYQDWVMRTEHELAKGFKTAIIAEANKRIVGDLVYQQHKSLPKTMELKNMRIHPDVKDRYFAQFMLRNAEREARLQGMDRILCDVRETPAMDDVLNVLFRTGYNVLFRVPLYESMQEEIVLSKELNKAPRLMYKSGVIALNSS
ncbi:MAG: GNAT family N-acetyltransferase [archaeon]